MVPLGRADDVSLSLALFEMMLVRLLTIVIYKVLML